MVTHNDSVSMIKINLQLASYQITCFVAILSTVLIQFHCDPSCTSIENVLMLKVYFTFLMFYLHGILPEVFPFVCMQPNASFICI